MIKLLLCYITVMTDLDMLRITTSYDDDDDDDKSWQLFTGLLLGLALVSATNVTVPYRKSKARVGLAIIMTITMIIVILKSK